MKISNNSLKHFFLSQKKRTQVSLDILSPVKAMLIPSLLKRWQHNYQSRIALAKLNPSQIKDIGLSEAAVQTEIRKPFWK